jgi:hypothetical protein
MEDRRHLAPTAGVDQDTLFALQMVHPSFLSSLLRVARRWGASRGGRVNQFQPLRLGAPLATID